MEILDNIVDIKTIRIGIQHIPRIMMYLVLVLSNLYLGTLYSSKDLKYIC